MMVMEKTRDIAVLMSFGVRARSDSHLLIQGLLIQHYRHSNRPGCRLHASWIVGQLSHHPNLGGDLLHRLFALRSAAYAIFSVLQSHSRSPCLATLYPSGRLHLSTSRSTSV